MKKLTLILVLILLCTLQIQNSLCYVILEDPEVVQKLLTITLQSNSGKTTATIPHIPNLDMPDEWEEPLRPVTVTPIEPFQLTFDLPPTWIKTETIQEAIQKTIQKILEIFSNAIIGFFTWLGNALIAVGQWIYNGIVTILNLAWKGIIRTIELLFNLPANMINTMWTVTAGSLIDFLDTLGIYGWTVSALCWALVAIETGIFGYALIKMVLIILKAIPVIGRVIPIF